MAETFTDEDLGIGTLFSDEDVGLDQPALTPEDEARILKNERYRNLQPPIESRISFGPGGMPLVPTEGPYLPPLEALAYPKNVALEQLKTGPAPFETMGASPTLAKRLAGVEAGAVNLVKTVTDPTTLALGALSGAPAIVQRLATGGFMADMLRQTPQVYQRLGDAFGRNDPEAEAEALFDAVAHGAFTTATGHATFRGAKPAQIKQAINDFIQRTPREQREQLYKGETDASRIEKAAKVHGDVRAQPIEGVPEVPVEEGGKGVQSQVEERVQAPEEKLLELQQLTPKELEGELAKRLLQEGFDKKRIKEDLILSTDKEGNLIVEGKEEYLKFVAKEHLQKLGFEVVGTTKGETTRMLGKIEPHQILSGYKMRPARVKLKGEGEPVPELQRDVAADVPPEALEHPVQVEAPDGTRRTAFFNGYYELPGMEPLISVGYKLPDGHLSHGMVKPGEKVIGKIPTLEEWKQSKIEQIELEPVIKSGDLMLPGRSHGQALEKATGTGNTELILKALSGEKGFRDKKTGKFYNRKEAAEIFKKQGGDVSKMMKPEEGLHSEDLKYLPKKETDKGQNVPRGTTGETQPEAVLSLGPGAASPKDIGTQSQITQLTQSIQNTASPKQPIGQRIQNAVKTVAGAVKTAPQTTGQAIKAGVQKLAAVAGAIKSGLTQLPEFTDFKRILGKWDGADQQAAFETRKFVQEINRRMPKDRQEAITNWIQAGGDPAVLQQRAAASTNAKLKKGYQDALTLTADEKVAAQNISNYLDSKLQEGLTSGLLDHGLENYINQVWKKLNPVTLKLQADMVTGKLQPNFKFARQRVFDHYFEGEQLGYVPANKSVGALIGIYDQSFNRALSARAFIKNLTEGKAVDGRPLVATSGSAGLVLKVQPPEALLVRPKTKPEDTADYKVIDHSALRKWMWQSQTPEGTPVFVQGDLLVHPEIYQHLKNVLGKSAWRQNKLGRAILGTEATIKQTMFSASGFHQVQETLHALGHRVNPTNLSDIDFNNPVHKEAVEHGLQLASYDAMEQFTDGLGSGPIINKIPIIGKRLLGPYTEWLFQDYIPRLKMTMYEHALGRNAERYQDQIASGKMTRDQLLELTAKQANAAFGEQNYNWIGRSKTTQDSLRAFIVAPDFLEARAKFVGQALRPHGREQLVALGLLAATQYITARILNKAIDDEYHWDKPFSLVARKHEYELRTVPGDIAHLIKDPKKFATSRLAPIMRQGIEFVTGRDWRGVKRDALDQIKDFAKLPTPISLRQQDDQRWWETFLNAFGIHERSATASQEIADKARQFREKAKGKATVEILEDQESPYRKLRVALDVGNEKEALKALQELRKTHGDSRILSTMQSHIRHPFTGSVALEHKFRQSLEPVELKKYQEAMVERKERYQKFKQLWGKRGQKPGTPAQSEVLTDQDVGL